MQLHRVYIWRVWGSGSLPYCRHQSTIWLLPYSAKKWSENSRVYWLQRLSSILVGAMPNNFPRVANGDADMCICCDVRGQTSSVTVRIKFTIIDHTVTWCYRILFPEKASLFTLPALRQKFELEYQFPRIGESYQLGLFNNVWHFVLNTWRCPHTSERKKESSTCMSSVVTAKNNEPSMKSIKQVKLWINYAI